MNEELIGAVVSESVQTKPEEGSPPSTDKHNASPDEKKSFALDKRFSKLTGDVKDSNARADKEREGRETAEKRASEAEEKIALLSAPKAPNETLQLDNPEEFDRQLKIFNDHQLGTVHTNAVKVAETNILSRMEADKKLEDQRKQRDEFQKKSNDFVKTGEGVGLKEEELTQIATYLHDSGMPSEIQSFLFDDSEGPQIMDFLANNPEDLGKMLEMNPIQQSAFIEKSIRANAVSAKPTVSGAPVPLINPQGGGAQELDDFDKACPGAKIVTS